MQLLFLPCLYFFISRFATGLLLPANHSLLELLSEQHYNNSSPSSIPLQPWPEVGTPLNVDRTDNIIFNITTYGPSFPDVFVTYVTYHLDTISEMILRHRGPKLGPDPLTYTSGDVTFHVFYFDGWTLDVEDLYLLVEQLTSFTDTCGAREIELGFLGTDDGRRDFVGRAAFVLEIVEHFTGTSKKQRSLRSNDTKLLSPLALPKAFGSTDLSSMGGWPLEGTIVNVDPTSNKAAVRMETYGDWHSAAIADSIMHSLVIIWKEIYDAPFFAGPSNRRFADGKVSLQVVFLKDWSIPTYDLSMFVTMLYYLTQWNGPRDITYGEIGRIDGRGKMSIQGVFSLKIVQ